MGTKKFCMSDFILFALVPQRKGGLPGGQALL
jgi:hypothetical protein